MDVMDVVFRTLVFVFCAVPCVQCVSVRNATDLTKITYLNGLQHYPVVLDEGEVHHLEYNWTYMGTNASILVIVSNEEIIKLQSDHLINLYDTNNFSLEISAVFLGRSYLDFYINKSLPGTERSPSVDQYNTQWYKVPDRFEIVVRRKEGILNSIFTVSVIVLVCLANVAMGCKTDLQVVKQTLKKPVAPVTGLVSQFVLMPMIAFGLGYAMSLEPALAFGLFATGCSPGGSASNVYTYLLDGNVSLSVTMTFVSTILSLGMVPLWLFTLGIHVIYHASSISIPYQNIVTSLLGLLIPVLIGLLIQRKKPAWAKIILKGVKPIAVLFLILVFTLGIYANLYIFRLLKPFVLISGALAPYGGFLFGAVVALLTGQSKGNILTIAIETGIQNTGVAIVLLQLSLPPPDSDISIVPPIAAAIFTPIPLLIAIIIHEVRKRCCHREPKEVCLNENISEGNQQTKPNPEEDNVKMISYSE